ncbi:MAG TPA: monovalent cation/H+ antiporter complex subunit F [Clostridiales bacterium]|nr:monovalent cation/H+ antiporter complex subunit F [Clostridiales bacterium]
MMLMLAGLTVLILIVLVRAIIGPTVIDRLISINAITSKVSVVILLIAFVKHEFGVIDISIVYMMCGFAGALWILRVLTLGDWHLRLPGIRGFEGDREEVQPDD